MITHAIGWVNRGAAWRVKNSNVRLEWQSHSFKLHEKLGSAYGETENRTLHLLLRRQE